MKGYYYLRDAVLEVYEDPILLKNMMEGLYTKLALTYKIDERAIRNAVEITAIVVITNICAAYLDIGLYARFSNGWIRIIYEIITGRSNF